MTVAGDLNQRIRIERRVKGGNSRGEVTYTWLPVVTVYAQASPLRGRDLFAAAQAHSEITTRFRIRYRTGVDETMRVIWKGSAYDIKSPPIEVADGREWIDLLCKAGVVAEGR